MAATETRLLLLGAVMLFEPINGYQLRRELLSWQVEDWASINPGSIYSGLATLTKQGFVTRHNLPEGARVVAVYTSTPEGRREFDRLYGEAVEVVDPIAPVAFHTAIALIPLVTRKRFLRHLKSRLERIDQRMETAQAEAVGVDLSTIPPHLPPLIRYWDQMAATERAWVADLLKEVEDGGISFRGEPSAWAPPADDPGWQISADRERYRKILGLD